MRTWYSFGSMRGLFVLTQYFPLVVCSLVGDYAAKGKGKLTLGYLVLVDALQNGRVKVAEDARAVGHKKLSALDGR